MLELTRWNPTLPRYRDAFDRLFDQFFNGEMNQAGTGSEEARRSWAPRVDIRETDERFEVIAELPGLTKKDIEITLENSVLTLRGERRFEKDTGEGTYHRIERNYGSFARSFSLPSRVDSEKVEASFKDGVLTISVPKVEEAKPRKIAIS